MFNFKQFQYFPKPCLSFWGCVVFFGLMAWGYAHLNNSKLYEINSQLPSFLEDIHSGKNPPPEIFIGGSSRNGCAIHQETLKQRLNMTVGKGTISYGVIWECEHVLKKYRQETQNVKLVLLDFHSNRLTEPPYAHHFQSGRTFQLLCVPDDFSPEHTKFVEELKKRQPSLANFSLTQSKFLPTKTGNADFIRKLRQKKENGNYHENHWSNWKTLRGAEATQARLIHRAKELGENANVESHINKYSDEMEESIWKFVQYCQSRDIFVVFNITPVWYSTPSHYVEGRVLTEADQKFLNFCQALNTYPNCKIICLKNFHEIIPNADDSKYFIDDIHMSKEGAIVYTNWLINQMLDDPKVAATLKSAGNSVQVAQPTIDRIK